MFLIDPYGFGDSDAQSYIAAIQTADGQQLEDGVANAIKAFVAGCKTDGNWNAIKASCILAGARTLAGALVPLVGTAPTNNNFVSADYDRKTGLKGNGTTKNLNSNRTSNADPRLDAHYSCYVSSLGAGIDYMGTQFTINAADFNGVRTASNVLSFSSRGANYSASYASPAGSTTGFLGASRSSDTSFNTRFGGNSYVSTGGTYTPNASNFMIFSRVGGNYSAARIAFYSIGQAVDLALLDSRVTTLINAYAAAIP